MTNEKMPEEEVERIRVNLNQASRELYHRSSRMYFDMELSSSIYKTIQEYKDETGLISKLFFPKKFKHAKERVNDLERLEYLRKSSIRLLDIVDEKTREPMSLQDLAEVRKKIDAAETEWRISPQFKDEKHPDTDIYTLKFQFPDFVKCEFEKLLNMPLEEIKNINGLLLRTSPISMLAKYAKQNEPVSLKVFEKLIAVYRFNRHSGNISGYSLSSGNTLIENDAISNALEIGSALGLTSDEVKNTYLSGAFLGDYAI